jgi:hypothetical protein
MDNSTRKSGAVSTTGALLRVRSQWPQPAARRIAVTAAPVQGSTLPISGMARLGHGTTTTATATSPISFVDVRPFRSPRPPL